MDGTPHFQESKGRENSNVHLDEDEKCIPPQKEKLPPGNAGAERTRCCSGYEAFQKRGRCLLVVRRLECRALWPGAHVGPVPPWPGEANHEEGEAQKGQERGGDGSRCDNDGDDDWKEKRVEGENFACVLGALLGICP